MKRVSTGPAARPDSLPGDGCTIFREGTERLAGIIDLEALVAYFGAHSPVAPGPQNRITFVP